MATSIATGALRPAAVVLAGVLNLVEHGGQDPGAVGALADRGRSCRAGRNLGRLLACRMCRSGVVGPVPGGAGGVGVVRGAGARHQRRAEDDGRDHPDVDHCRSAACPLGTAALSSPPQASSSRWAPPQAAGGSSIRWTGGSATSRVPLALRRRAPARPSSSARAPRLRSVYHLARCHRGGCRIRGGCRSATVP